jgi:acetyl-CoA synthetase (ADP-forming)
VPTLSEARSKELVSRYGVPVADERVVASPRAAVAAAIELGFPVVVKLGGDGIAHKTERGLVRLGVRTEEDVEVAAIELLAAATPADGPVELLVAPMLKGNRELIAGLHTDAQFGPTVMLGLGGVLAEAIQDVVFRLVPIDEVDAYEMIEDLETQRVLGEFRGEPAVDREALARALLALSALAQHEHDVVSVDVNPLILVDGKPVAVDALVEMRA